MTATPAAAPAPAITDTAIPVMNVAASAIVRRPAMSAGAAMKKKSTEPIPVMDYGQFRRARKLVHECCNYDNGQCIALDEGDGCVCVQSISHSLLCRWFRCAVLPLDRELEAALFHRLERKKCSVCARLFLPGSNRAKYCPDCAARMKRKHAAERKRKQRRICNALGTEKAL